MQNENNDIIYKNTLSRLTLSLPLYFTIVFMALGLFVMDRGIFMLLPIFVIFICIIADLFIVPAIIRNSIIVITNKTLEYKFTLLSNINECVMLNKISKVKVYQNFMEIILGVGKIGIIDISGEMLVLRLINNPQLVASILIKNINN